MWGTDGNAALIRSRLTSATASIWTSPVVCLIASRPPTFCRASSSTLFFFSSCLLAALVCSSRERLVDNWAFSYSSLLSIFSTPAFRRAASASCCKKKIQIKPELTAWLKCADWQRHVGGGLTCYPKSHTQMCKKTTFFFFFLKKVNPQRTHFVSKPSCDSSL